MIVGTAPGEMEEEAKKPFSGKSGQLLREILEDLGIEDAFKTNVLKRRPMAYDGTNRKPSKKECWRCGSHLVEEIVRHRPKVIIALGQMPLQFLLTGKRIPKVTVARGLAIRTVRFQLDFVLVPTYDPSFVLRRGGLLSAAGDEWVSDLETATDIVRRDA